MNKTRYRSWGISHPGAKRKYNEDTFVNRPDLGLWAVADGAGGHQAGEVASGMIREALEAIPPELSASELLAEVRIRIAATHDALRQMAEERGDGAMIASTVVAVLIRNEYCACLWAGDSRFYLLRNGVLRQITKDHSLVQDLVDSGAITEDEAENHPRANVITRAVGADMDDFVLDKTMERLQPGDRLLLCSDGLCKTLSNDTLAALLGAEIVAPPPQILIEAALAESVTDNVTAVTIEILG